MLELLVFMQRAACELLVCSVMRQGLQQTSIRKAEGLCPPRVMPMPALLLFSKVCIVVQDREAKRAKLKTENAHAYIQDSTSASNSGQAHHITAVSTSCYVSVCHSSVFSC